MSFPDSNINQVSKHLYLIALSPPIRGFNHFIGSWLYNGKKTYLVDVGPSVTVEALKRALQAIGIKKLDYIFITHIHIDHAGAIGEMAASFPETPIICHPAGISHLVDPTRLWEGTVKTLGDIGRSYGPVRPVPEKQLVGSEDFSSNSITPVITPGHSPHHVSFLTDDFLFAGEAGGMFLSLSLNRMYLRPATPPRFFLDIFIKSIDTLIDRCPNNICYGHFGMQENAVEMLNVHRDQLLLWEKVVKDELSQVQSDDFLTTCMNRLLDEDPLLSGFYSMDGGMQQRERFFLTNSIKGFAGYIEG